MSLSCFLGIDPGLDGALALYTPETNNLEIEDVPVLDIRGGRIPDHYGLARIIDAWAPHNPTVLIEHVASRPGQGVASMFKFGLTTGLLRGVCAAHFLTIEFVTPTMWKTAMGAKGDKDESLARACAVFPKHTHLFARKKDHGRTDAALIAKFAARRAREN